MPTQLRAREIPVAIIGMACRLPGADGLDEFWQLVRNGASAIRELPADRLDQELYYDPERGTLGKSYCKVGALCASRDLHPDRCPLPEELLRASDPVHLVMCEVAADACRHAHLDPFDLPWRNTGVYVGNTQGSPLCGDAIYSSSVREAAQFLYEANDFCQLPVHDQHAVIDGLVEHIRGAWPHRHEESPDVSTSMIAGLISKAFALTGPYVAVNSACASSLQAMLMAVRALQLGKIDMAIVGGASDCKGDTLTLFSAAQSLSASDSRPFDAQADGMICGEGYVALVLKTLPRALADDDIIQAIISGIGVSSDGRGKSLWAPRKEGQILAMQRAYASPEEMSRLQYIEAHATSTQIGDATELSALAHVLRHVVPKGARIPIGSVKANIGHALEAAGVASLIKTILCLQHRTIPPAINVRRLNPNIDWDDAPLLVPQVAAPWPAPTDDSPRRAAVNAFGIGGLNVHVVVDEFSDEQRTQIAARWRSPGAAAANPPRRADAVAVIGIGCILPGAHDRASYWDLIRSGRDPKSHAPPERWKTDLSHVPGTKESCSSTITLGGFVTDFQYDWRRHKVPPKQIDQADPLQFMLLDAADQALADAGYGNKSFDRTRTGVIVGTEVGGDFAVQLQMGLRIPHMQRVLQELLAEKRVLPDQIARICQQFGDVLLAHWPALLDETGSFTTSTLASRMTKTFDLMGGAAAVDSGSTSSETALMVCAEMLLAGDCDLMLCAAGHRRMGLAAYEALSASGQLVTSGSPRAPFDAHPNGLVPAEGAAVLLLKRLSDAQRDGDRIHAIVESVGVAHAAGTGRTVQLAVERCLSSAGVAPNQVALVETVGCGNSTDDQDELRALLTSYDQSGRSQPLLLSSVTAQIGHAGGACGMASLIRAGLQLANGVVGPTWGLEQPLDFVKRHCDVVHPSQPPRPIRASDGRCFASLSSCSKGLAFHILLERPTPLAVASKSSATKPARKAVVSKSPRRAANALRICRIGAASWPQLAHEARHATQNVDSFWRNATSRLFAPDEEVRLAIVADSAESFSEKLQLAAEQLDRLGATDELERRGVFARELLPRHPRVAFVFPGQGSHYQGMLEPLVHADPHAATALRTIDAALLHHGLPNFAEMAWGNEHRLGQDIGTSQLAMLAADWIMFQTLLGRGVRPDVVLGHSFGEFAALTAAGVWTLQDAIGATEARVDGIRQSDAKDGAMLAIAAAPATVRRLMHQIAEPVYVANHNSPQQTVVGGSRGALEQLAAVLGAQSCPHEFLPVPCAFHTPLMEGAAAKLAAALEHIRLSPPRIPLLSSVTNRYVSEPERMRENLVVQLTTPVRYMELVEKLAAEDQTIFVEVGPNNILTRIHRRILAGRETPGIAATDGLKIGPVESILRVQAMLECLGVHESLAPDEAKYTPTPPPPGDIVSRRDETPDVIHFDATRRRRDKLHESASAQSDRRSVKSNDRAAPAAIGRSDHASGDNNRTTPSATDIAPQSAAPGYVDRTNNRAPMRSVTTHVATPQQVADMPAAATEKNASVALSAAAEVAMLGVGVAGAERCSDAPARSRRAGTGASLHRSAPATPSQDSMRVHLERFLVNFVVEQTGYPADVVDLDADLEADLGIDSIKKAQMFGELQEYFHVTPSEDLTLDDFPTLRHVLDFLRNSPAKRTLPDSVVPATDSPADADTRRASLTEPATVRTSLVATPPRNASARASATATSTEQLQSFLVNFVVEQTGYPPDVVDLDADLEADLGIDSIKKAQMFGELQEYFDVTPSEELTLDDFPTLRHVLDFLRDVPARKRIPDSTPSDVDFVTSDAHAAPLEPTRATTTTLRQPSAATQASGLADGIEPEHAGPHLVLRGDAYQMGYQHGTQKRAEILDILRGYADRTDPLPIPAGVIEHPQRCFSEDDLAELEGLADAVGVPKASLIFHNLALAADQGTSALSLASPFDGQAQAGMNPLSSVALPAQSGLRPSAMPLVQVRWPKDGQPQRVHSFVGGIGAVGGLSAARTSMTGSSLGVAAQPFVVPGPPYDFETESREPPPGTRRFLLRMLDVPLPDEIPQMPAWTGVALVIGTNRTAVALRSLLRSQGVTVQTLDLVDDTPATIAKFDRLWRERPITHLFIMTARDEPESTDVWDQASWQVQCERVALEPFFLCQRWIELASQSQLLDQCTLVATTALGGDFGFASKVNMPLGGALTGLVKAIHVELNAVGGHKGLVVKAIDAPLDEPPELLARSICRELAGCTGDYEVAFVDGHRRLQNAYPQDADVRDECDIRRGATWIVTGGARGITAACALELGKRFGLVLHLIGTSPSPQIDATWRDLSDEGLKQLRGRIMRNAQQSGKPLIAAWDTVQKAIEIDETLYRFEQAGVQAAYHQCDVSDCEALNELLQKIRRQHGPIEGILHGAGLERSASVLRKEPHVVRATLAAKVHGARNLMALTADDPVRHFIAFGSVSGRLGSVGQTDYCMASDLLAKLIQWYRAQRPECHAVAIHWHPWDHVGMAARADRRSAMQMVGAPPPMPPREGIRHLLRELYAGGPEGEVLITSQEYYERFYGLGASQPLSPLGKIQPPRAPDTQALPGGPARDSQDQAAGATSRITQRMILQLVPASKIPSGIRNELFSIGAAVILGSNTDAEALRERIEMAGANVHRLALRGDPEAAIAEFDSLWARAPVTHLFLLTARDQDAACSFRSHHTTDRLHQGVVVPFMIVQRWLQRVRQAGLADRAALVAATNMGGDFGISGHVRSAEGGALAGLLKGLRLEAREQGWEGVRFRVVDFPHDTTPSHVAEVLCMELLADEPDIEVGYQNGVRRLVRVASRPVKPKADTQIHRGGVWVITGGARGITALVARELARRYDLRLHLLGTTRQPQADEPWHHLSEHELEKLKERVLREARDRRHPPAQAWAEVEKSIEIERNLRALSQAGAQATYHVCDVSQRDQLAQVIEKIRAMDGPIEGVIHGAAYVKDAWFPNKKLADVEKTLQVKVGGAAWLMELTRRDPLQYFIAFSSVAGRFGAKGQTDYSAANEMLSKLVLWYRTQRPDCLAVAIDWHPWAEAGLATRPEIKARLESIHMDLMPAEEGIESLLDELLAGTPDGEVVVTQPEHYRTSYPLPVVAGGCLGQSDSDAPARRPAGASLSLCPSHPPALDAAIGQLPLVDAVIEREAGRRIVTRTKLDPASDPFLIEHRLRGKPLLPAVMALELIGQTATLLDGRQVVGFRDVQIHRGLKFVSPQPLNVEVIAELVQDGAAGQLLSTLPARATGPLEARSVHLTATALLDSSPAVPAWPFCGQPPLGWYPIHYDDQAPIYHGPKLRCVKNFFFQYDGGYAKIVAPDIHEIGGARNGAQWILPTAALDACLYACAVFTYLMFQQRVEIPSGFDQIELYRLPNAGEECVLRIYYRDRDERITTYDFVLFGSDGQALLAVQGYGSATLGKAF